MARKLVLGAGYLGSRVANRWAEQGHQVHVVTRSPEKAQRFGQCGWQVHQGDITQPESLASLATWTFDTVLYAVGYDPRSGIPRAVVTLQGLQHMIALLANRTARWIHISTTGVYGQQDGAWVDEASPCSPQHEAGQLAWQAEQAVHAGWSERCQGGGSYCLLRLAGIYGPERLLARGADLRRGEPLAGSPDAWLNLIHVEDAVTAVLRCEQILGSERLASGSVVLVCDDHPVLRGEYYAYLAQLLGAPPPVFDPSRAPRQGSGGLNKRCCNRRLRAELQVPLTYPTYIHGLSALL
ncbi:MAG: hypothetical protein KatS3mg114_0243 [Planctomycetaceae bacterium]|nr:MAG: hypothetical protein KatS3mg114_0243 [Planctomycetaceae bacterium]